MTEGPFHEALSKSLKALEKESVKRREAEKALRLAQRDLALKAEALKAANGELSQYAFISSHFLKAPLRAIRNYSDFLCEDLEQILNEEHKNCLDGLERAVRQGEELVDDLIDFSRVGIWHTSTEPIQADVFLRELIASTVLPANTRIWIEENDAGPVIDADPTLLNQIFEELIKNALKFNHSDRKCVEIGWRPRGGSRCELFVRDNGIGIEPRHHEQVFNIFQRLHSRLDYPGTGIGLATVRKAAFRLHGSVRVESELGKGSTFFVMLPATPARE